MDEPLHPSPTGALDRRGFIAAGLGAGALVLSGCGETASRVGQTVTGTAGRANRSAETATRALGRGTPIARQEPRRLAQAIRGHVFPRGTPGFLAAARLYDPRFDVTQPVAVARPVDARDVRDAVRWGVARGVALRARAGGHSYAGYSTLRDGIVLDLRRLNGIEVDRRAGIAHVGPGVQLGDLYARLAAAGATVPGGSCPSVGVAGVTLGGGMGLAGRAFGLTTDHLVGAQIVTADGHLRSADPDLLWALRGGGGGIFGVVTRFSFRVRRLPPGTAYFFVSWPWPMAAQALDAWLRWAPHADQRLTSVLHLNATPGRTSISVSGQYLGAVGDLAAHLAPIAAGASITTGAQDYLGLQARWAGCLGLGRAACHTVGTAPGGRLPRERFLAKSDYLDGPLPAAGLTVLTNAIEARTAGSVGSGAILFDSYGGAINRVHPHATAFVHRGAAAAIQYLTYGGGAGWLERTWRAMRPYVSGFAYQNYIDASLPDWEHAYYGSNYPRLRATRRAVDPHHYFRFPQAIT